MSIFLRCEGCGKLSLNTQGVWWTVEPTVLSILVGDPIPINGESYCPDCWAKMLESLKK